MPRYYFHIREDSGVALDCEGAEFNSLDAARTEARASACEVAAERLRASQGSARQIVEIADETGSIVETLAVLTVLE